MNAEPKVVYVAAPRRRRSFSLRLAMRSLITSLVAMAAGYVVQGALPKLASEAAGADSVLPAQLESLLQVAGGHLVYVPLPALALALAALVLRPLRLILALLAAAAALLALVVIAGSLIAGLAPMYQIPKDLMAG